MVVMTVLHGLAAAFAIVAITMVYDHLRQKKTQGVEAGALLGKSAYQRT